MMRKCEIKETRFGEGKSGFSRIGEFLKKAVVLRWEVYITYLHTPGSELEGIFAAELQANLSPDLTKWKPS